jgi:UPF0755 protein
MQRKTVIWLAVVLTILAALVLSSGFYRNIFGRNVVLSEKNEYLYIPTGADYLEVRTILEKEHWLKNISSFDWLAKKKNYPHHVNPGRYLLRNHMSNNELINLLRSGKQDPVDVTFHNVRTIEEMAAMVGRKIEADSNAIVSLLHDRTYVQEKKLVPELLPAIFLPNTYQFYWNTSARKFVERMITEHEHFWNDERQGKARALGMTPMEVTTLASIVEEEALHTEEMPMIAGVYLNRLRKGIALQADPTIKFALGDFTIKRILTKQLEINSPYNTYKHRGLPPGPIRITSIAAIESVLNATQHDYYYFCAKEDFSGYHYFSKTLDQHNVYARKYREALDRNRIMN